MDFFTYKMPNSLLFFIWVQHKRSRALVRVRVVKLRGTRAKAWAKKKLFFSPPPISPLFYHLFSLFYFFARRTRLWGKTDDCSHSTYFRHFLLLILIIYITLLLISSFQMIMTVIHWTVMTFFSLYCLKKLYDLLVISNIGSLTDFDLIPNAMSVCMQFQFKLFDFFVFFFSGFHVLWTNSRPWQWPLLT